MKNSLANERRTTSVDLHYTSVQCVFDNFFIFPKFYLLLDFHFISSPILCFTFLNKTTTKIMVKEKGITDNTAKSVAMHEVKMKNA